MNISAFKPVLLSGTLLLLGLFVILPGLGNTQGSAVQVQSRSVAFSATAGFVSEQLNPGVRFNAVAARWTGTDESELSIRYRSDGVWSDWIGITADEDGHGHEDTAAPHYSNLLQVPAADRVQYALRDAEAVPDSVELFFLDTIDELTWYEQFYSWIFPSGQAQDLDVISRSEWGADESYRFNGSEEEWPPEHEAPKTFILHHTAGSNGQPNLEQAKSVVRGIYYYHAVIRGWGDIGYNYLVDSQGNIFEGRYGGDGVMGAHTYRGADCPGIGGEQSYNRGSIGVALLGNYENIDYVSTAAKNSLSHFIAVKGRQLGIVPDGDVYFQDRTMPTVTGHGNLDCTTCPGVRFSNEFSDIRAAARAEYNTLPDPNGNASASLRGQSHSTISTAEGVTLSLWVDMRNDSGFTWTRYISAPILVASNDAARLLRSADWDGDTVAVLEQSSLAPGQTGRYRFSVTVPIGHPALEAKFALSHNSAIVAGTTAKFHFSVSDSPYAAQLLENGFPEAMLQNDSATITLRYTNTGRNAWQRNELHLVVRDPGGGPSMYEVHSASGGDVIPLDSGPIQPGQTASFTLTLSSPDAIGRYTQELALVRNGQDVVGSQYLVHTRVDSPSQAALVSQTIPVAMLNTWRVPVVIKFMNTGVTTWDQSVVLKVMNDDHGPSSFYDGSWRGAVGEIRMQENSVAPGATATYRFYLRSPVVPRVYVQNIELIDLDGAIDVIQHPVFDPLIRVDRAEPALNAAQYSAELVSESVPTAVRSIWRPFVTVRFRNTGSATWDSNTRLNVYGALFRRPEFRDNSWARETGGIAMNESRVGPGQVASFTFRMDAPAELQVYEILFQLSHGAERQVIPNSYFSELIRVDP